MAANREISRRRLLQDAAAVAGTAAIGGALVADANALRRRPRVPRSARGRRVAVLGGGVAGLSAAHELVERGFLVDVYERKALGGKARSIGVPGTARGGRRPLPGEHGARVFPGFYHNLPDTMRRIPFGRNPHGVWDNLLAAPDSKSPRTGGRPDGFILGVFPHPDEARTPAGMQRVLAEQLGRKGIPPHEGAIFAERMMVFATSSRERRFGEWEYVSWWDFIRAEGMSEEYKKVLARQVTRSLVACKERKASTRTMGTIAEAFAWTLLGRGSEGPPDRVLNAPTNEAWVDPWVRLLRRRGARFHLGHEVDALSLHKGRIEHALARDRSGRRRWIEADWFVSAMPAERARRLWSREILAADPRLELMNELNLDWMNGIQYYLKQPLEIVRGHASFVDAPWALTGLTQGQFWPNRRFARDYGDGRAVDCLSIDVADWDTPGIVYGKPAKRCTREQVAREVLEQLKAHLNDNGTPVLTDDMVHSWHLDPAISWSQARHRNSNDERLLVDTVGTWDRRPNARTRIPNLFLAGDYVRTNITAATMEGANESARAAVNGVLDASGSRAARVPLYELFVPPEFAAAQRVDAELYRRGQPNLLDHP